MKTLHLCSAHVPDFAAGRGGAVYYRQTAEALVRLGHEVHVKVINPAGADLAAPEGPWTSFEFLSPQHRARDAGDKWVALLNPAQQADVLAPGYSRFASRIATIIETGKYDLIVCDWIGSLVATPHTITVPILYIQHDFAHQIERVKRDHRIRKFAPRSLVSLSHLRQIEIEQIRKAAAVISASASEADRTERLTGRPSAYVPICGKPIPTPKTACSTPPRLFVFGFHNTAMSSSLGNIDRLFSGLAKRNLGQFHHVGLLSPKAEAAWAPLRAAHDITFHGYVSELEQVFQPGDILVSPYGEGTGFRTKFVTAAGHGLIVAGLDASFACAPEFVPGTNCIASPTVAGLVDALGEVLTDPARQRRLSHAARATYDQSFGIANHLSTYDIAVKNAVGQVAFVAE